MVLRGTQLAATVVGLVPMEAANHTAAEARAGAQRSSRAAPMRKLWLGARVERLLLL